MKENIKGFAYSGIQSWSLSNALLYMPERIHRKRCIFLRFIYWFIIIFFKISINLCNSDFSGKVLCRSSLKHTSSKTYTALSKDDALLSGLILRWGVDGVDGELKKTCVLAWRLSIKAKRVKCTWGECGIHVYVLLFINKSSAYLPKCKVFHWCNTLSRQPE